MEVRDRVARRQDDSTTIGTAIEHDPALGQALRANTIALHTIRPDPLWSISGGGHPVLLKAGSSLGEIGQVAAARDYHQTLHHISEQRLGPDHPDTLVIRNSLASGEARPGTRPAPPPRSSSCWPTGCEC